MLGALERTVLDVQVEVRLQHRAWRGVSRRATRTFRLVALRNQETGRYHCFLTNVSADEVDAETIAETYRLPLRNTPDPNIHRRDRALEPKILRQRG